MQSSVRVPHLGLPLRRLGLALCFSVTVCASSVLATGKTQRLRDLLPDDCLAYVSLSGLDDWSSKMEQHGLYGLWQEPDVQAFLGEALQALPAMISQHTGHEGIELRSLLEMVGGSIEIGAGDLTMVAVDNDVIAMPSIVVALDVGKGKDRFRGMLAELLGKIATPDHVRRGSFEYRGVHVDTFSPPNRPREVPFFDLKLCTAWLGDTFLFSVNPGYLQKVIDNHQDGTKKSLAKSEVFRRCESKTGGSPFVSCFLNIAGLRSRVDGLIPIEVREIAADLGLADVNALYLGAGVENGLSNDVFYVDAPGEKKGLLKILSLAPCRMDALRYAPDNAFAFFSLNLDVNGAKDEVFRLVSKYVPEALEEIRREMGQASREIGMDVEKDVLGALTGEINIFASMNPMGSFVPDVLLAVGVRDGAKFEKLFNHVLARGSGHVQTRTMEFKGDEISYLTIPGAPVMPAYRMQDGMFVVTVSPLMMKNILTGAEAGGKGLASAPSFKAALASCGKKKPSMLGYVDMRSLVVYAYNTFMPFVQGAVPSHVPLDMARLPTADVIVRHIEPDVCYYVDDGDGLVMKGRSSFGSAFILSLLARTLQACGDVKVPMPHGGTPSGYTRSEPVEPPPPVARIRSVQAPVVATTPPPAPPSADESQAVALYQSGELEGAIKAFDAVIAQGGSGRAYFLRGHCHHGLGQYAEFVRDSKKAAELGFQPGTAYYNVACGYSLLKKKDAALKYLALAIDNGFDNIAHIDGDSDMDYIRDDPEFEKLLEKID